MARPGTPILLTLREQAGLEELVWGLSPSSSHGFLQAKNPKIVSKILDEIQLLLDCE
jgi:hypothetical protein